MNTDNFTKQQIIHLETTPAVYTHLVQGFNLHTEVGYVNWFTITIRAAKTQFNKCYLNCACGSAFVFVYVGNTDPTVDVI